MTHIMDLAGYSVTSPLRFPHIEKKIALPQDVDYASNHFPEKLS